eukprot:TRINITY_DN7512_c0_g1_i1.p1 TRINITY_DN7512_c0_g1~~TRINITY_DN7512_c0_g1_i1.p1  ORF type:complete len:418 (-),score=105.11 TRINITY_DN7512_c0_g1_i1:1203-2429(-)
MDTRKKRKRRKRNKKNQKNKKRAIETTHQHSKSEKRKGDENYKAGNVAAAIVHYTRSIALCGEEGVANSPTFLVTVFTHRAIAHFQQQEYKKAVEDCNIALQLDTTNMRAYLCRAFCCFCQGYHPLGTRDFETACKLSPNHSSLQKRLSEIRREMPAIKGQEVDWIRDFQLLDFDLVHIEELEPPALRNNGKNANNTNGGKSKKNATKKRKSGGNRKQEKAEDIPEGGRCEEQLPALVPVGEALDTYISDLERLSPQQAKRRAFLEKEQGNAAFVNASYLTALVHYSRAIMLHAQESVFYTNRALVYLKLDRFCETITDCTTSIQRNPSIKAFHRRAAAWAALKEYERAASDYSKALHFEPNHPDCLDKLKKCLMHLEEDYAARLRKQPNDEMLSKCLKEIQRKVANL